MSNFPDFTLLLSWALWAGPAQRAATFGEGGASDAAMILPTAPKRCIALMLRSPTPSPLGQKREKA